MLYSRKSIEKHDTFHQSGVSTYTRCHSIFRLSNSNATTLDPGYFYFKMVIREIPFIAIVFIGLADLIIGSFYFQKLYGTSSYPITANVLGLLNNFDTYF